MIATNTVLLFANFVKHIRYVVNIHVYHKSFSLFSLQFLHETAQMLLTGCSVSETHHMSVHSYQLSTKYTISILITLLLNSL